MNLRPFRFLLAVALLLFGGSGPLWAQGLPAGFGPQVARIDLVFVGPKEVNEQLVRANISARVGDTFSPLAVDQDVRNLYAMGLFLNIRVNQEVTPAGIILTYNLQPRPKLTEISFSGNKKYSNKKLLKLIKSKIGEPVDEQRLFNDTLEIKKKYAGAGYPDTQAKYVLSVDEPAGRATVRFEVAENAKQRIINVVFDGAKAFPQKKLRKVVKTRRWWWLSWLTGSGKLKPAELDEDRDRLRDFYWERGYIDFDVKDIAFEFPETNRMVVIWKVFEGNPYKVGDITIKGATLFPTNQIAKIMPMKPGDTYTPKGMEKDTGIIEDFYGARGYIDVTEASRNLVVGMIPNTEKTTIDLEYNITEGQKSYIEHIEIRGNWKTKDRVLRRELSVYPGDTFDMVKVKLSQRRLEGLNFFDKVDAKPEATDMSNRKNLVVSVDEKTTGSVSVGAGFSSVDSLVGFVELTQGNFDLFHPPSFQGGGQKARLRLALGTQRKDIVAGFTEPWFLGRKLALNVEGFYSQLDYMSVNDLYRQNEGGGRVGLTKPVINEFFIGNLYYSIENIGIVDVNNLIAPPDIQDSEGYTLLSTIGGGIAWDTRNSTLLPNRGGRSEITASITGGPLGGDASFYKLEFRNSRYFPGFAKGHVLELIGRVGVGQAFGNSDDIPFFKRYYLGGLYSLRGYKYRDIGPKQLTGDGDWEPIGGNTYWFASAEYSIPVIERVRLAAFYDCGMVYPGSFSFHPGTPDRAIDAPGYATGTYASDFGFGIRLNLPIGPLRLDYAIPMKHDDTVSGKGRFQFGVGYTREF